MPLHPYPRFLPGIWGGKGPIHGKVVRPRKSRSKEKKRRDCLRAVDEVGEDRTIRRMPPAH